MYSPEKRPLVCEDIQVVVKGEHSPRQGTWVTGLQEILTSGRKGCIGKTTNRAFWPYLRASCPKISNKMLTCKHECVQDSDCSPLQLCCSNGCGRECVIPHVEEEAACGCSVAFIADKMPGFVNMSAEEIMHLNEFLLHAIMQSVSPSLEIHLLYDGLQKSLGGPRFSNGCQYKDFLDMLKTVHNMPNVPYFDPFNKPSRKLVAVVSDQDIIGNLQQLLYLKEIFQTICLVMVGTDGVSGNQSALDAFHSGCVFKIPNYTQLFGILDDIVGIIQESCKCPGDDVNGDASCAKVGKQCRSSNECDYLSCVSGTCQLPQCTQPDIVKSFGIASKTMYDMYETEVWNNIIDKESLVNPLSFPFAINLTWVKSESGNPWIQKTVAKEPLTGHQQKVPVAFITDMFQFTNATTAKVQSRYTQTRASQLPKTYIRTDQHHVPDFTPPWLYRETSFATGCCPPGLLHCSGYIGMCVFGELLCDGISHCIHGEDEDPQMCSERKCDVKEFRCRSGQCIGELFICDGKKDCTDGSDEFCQGIKDCPSPRSDYCGSGDCIHPSQRCDGITDCTNGSDELFCNCTGFKCKSGECIPQHNICNGNTECTDGSDENPLMCKNHTCESYEYQCTSGMCIYKQLVCNGEIDCNDGSDESVVLCRSHSCPYPYWQCESGHCIYDKQVCDTVPDCEDRSDESNEFCKKCIGFHCNTGHCYEIAVRCNGEDDCPDGSDEENCINFLCANHSFHCSSGECIDDIHKFNGREDCADGSDEITLGMSTKCTKGKNLQCPTGECIDEKQMCNGVYDCDNFADESLCLEIKCPVQRPFQCASGQCIENSDARCNGIIECLDSSDEMECNSISCPLSRPFRCDSGHCLSKDMRCDGIFQCKDRSDEDDCGDVSCPHDCQFRCKSGECIWNELVCDYVRHCWDGSDEALCNSWKCPSPKSFKCRDGACIYDFEQCDGNRDCMDGSDEMNCPP
ncbi:sortilin-related receptor-like [Macrobrachium nipponense]|uniref:sortilin-related receptor-like n=1 Tax=Macrobrachium nipponense TaxID=159736 RepID=UPI0030C895FA